MILIKNIACCELSATITEGMEGSGMQVIQQSSSSSLQTCSDRLHMPGNLEFISPPFLISAPVIQINSNEISRGKAPFGWGVCSSLQLSPIQRPSSPSEGPNNPPSHPSPLLQSGSSSTCGGTNLSRCHSQGLGPQAWAPLVAWGDSPWKLVRFPSAFLLQGEPPRER